MKHNRPPLSGVFAVKSDKYFGVANLGFRPTFEGDKKLHLEVHFLNFSSDLYGQHISIDFLKKLRGEIKFSSVEKLKEQIVEDIKMQNFFLINKINDRAIININLISLKLVFQ